MTAYLILRPTGSGDEITFDQVQSFIEKSGITYGLNSDIIIEKLNNKQWNEEIIIARGTPAEKGADGMVNFMFDTSPPGRPKIKEDGRVDFLDLHTAQCVKAGDKLAELVAPTEGVPGTNIHGQSIPAPKGKAAKILRGINTVFADDSRNILLAETDGNVKLTPSGSVEVSQSLSISGDVDLGTGNIEVVGDLIVSGDIKAGLRVKATGNIEIGGAVEDAHVTADGSVIVKGGFLGEGVGEINAGRDVLVKYVYRQTINAVGDIEIIEESTQAKLSADGIIRINRGKGILVGGTVRAGKGIEAKIIGNEQNTKTEILLGGRTDLRKQIETLQKSHSMYETKLNEIADQMSKLMVRKKKMGLNLKDEEKFRILDKLSADIERSLSVATAEIQEQENDLEELKKTAYVDICQKIFPGVSIKIAGLYKYISAEREKTKFKIVGSEIIGIEEETATCVQSA